MRRKSDNNNKTHTKKKQILMNEINGKNKNIIDDENEKRKRIYIHSSVMLHNLCTSSYFRHAVTTHLLRITSRTL